MNPRMAVCRGCGRMVNSRCNSGKHRTCLAADLAPPVLISLQHSLERIFIAVEREFNRCTGSRIPPTRRLAAHQQSCGNQGAPWRGQCESSGFCLPKRAYWCSLEAWPKMQGTTTSLRITLLGGSRWTHVALVQGHAPRHSSQASPDRQ